MGSIPFIGPILRDPWVRGLGLLLILLVTVNDRLVRQLPGLVDWPTIAAITGLLILAKAVELSGYLDIAAHRIVTKARTLRQLAMGLILLAALIAAWVSNDIALFILLPLTLSAARVVQLPVASLVSFEALAVNAGSSLTPIGNPQNLFLWHMSGDTIPAFTTQMLPLAATLISVVLLLAWWAFPARPLARFRTVVPERRPRILILAGVLYGFFLVAMEANEIWPALVVVVVVLWMASPSILQRADWALVAAFILVFADFRGIAEMHAVTHLLHSLSLGNDQSCFLWAVLTSQLLSNVPAAISLSGFTHNWLALSYGVNVGGLGLAVGSLANLIALRAVPGRQTWLTFHLYSLLALALAVPLGLGLI